MADGKATVALGAITALGANVTAFVGTTFAFRESNDQASNPMRVTASSALAPIHWRRERASFTTRSDGSVLSGAASMGDTP